LYNLKNKTMTKKDQMEWKHIWDMTTFQCVENEVYMGGVYFDDDGNKKDITLVFTTYQFLEWIGGNLPDMKKQLTKYINQLN
tara:strand:+ start:1013 stop:1258 length:246 start_codon:yes stop_codon:yes gene_type:complete